MRLPKLVLAAAVAAVFPLVAGAQTAGVKGQGADNIETVPQSQPTSPFNQGIGGVGNQGQVGSGSIHGSRDRSSPSTSGYGASASGAGSTLPERYDPRPDTANTEGNPHTQPRGEFSQGIGGVGNEGRTGRNADTLASNTAAQDAWRQCQAMQPGPMRDSCVRDYTMNYGAAGDPDGRFYNKSIGGVGGVPPQ